MNHFSYFRKTLKHYLPAPIRVVNRAVLTYAQRIGRWVIIFIQMRGATFTDQLKLIVSALVAPFISLRSITRWQNPQLLFDIEVVVFDIGRFELRQGTDDLWHVLPWREKEVLNVLRSRLRSGDVCVDEGANIGFYTIVASKLVGLSGRVISIEMMPDTATILRRHCEINNVANVKIEGYALSERPGETIIARVPKGSYGQASIGVVEMVGDIHEIEVQTTILDELLAEIADIRLIKMDLEGAELVAIKGAEKALKKTSYITFESWDCGGDNQVLTQLIEMGFSISVLDGRNLLAQRF